jgi:hypothetical protein
MPFLGRMLFLFWLLFMLRRFDLWVVLLFDLDLARSFALMSEISTVHIFHESKYNHTTNSKHFKHIPVIMTHNSLNNKKSRYYAQAR